MKQRKRFGLLLLFAVAWVFIAEAYAASAYPSFDTVTSQAVITPKEAQDEPHAYLPMVASSQGVTYYVSPSGNDANSGRTPAEAWATFDRGLNENAPGAGKLGPGDTLILLDGTYYQSLHPHRVTGEPGRPITVRAQHDGKAIIDGQGTMVPVQMEKYRAASYFVIEGIVARNSSAGVFQVTADRNTFRRVSGYNANTDRNSSVFGISADYTVLEDCVATGTGRKMIIVYKGEHNVIRRCFADWQKWDGREWHDCWPWGDGIEIYNASNNIIENSIAYTRYPRAAISLLAQGGGSSSGNQILGAMAILSGMKADGTPMVWGDTRPQPTEYTCVRDIENWPGQRSGFKVYESGSEIKDNLLQDILAWGSAGLGITWTTGGSGNIRANNHVNRATLFDNGLDNPDHDGGVGTDAVYEELALFETVKNSHIETIYTGSSYTTMNGEGARLTHRYVNGILLDGSNGQPAQPLWPWPMEDRIQAELGISVTDMMTAIIFGDQQ